MHCLTGMALRPSIPFTRYTGGRALPKPQLFQAWRVICERCNLPITARAEYTSHAWTQLKPASLKEQALAMDKLSRCTSKLLGPVEDSIWINHSMLRKHMLSFVTYKKIFRFFQLNTVTNTLTNSLTDYNDRIERP